MLIKCPECGKEISDKATLCPNCGCPSSEWDDKSGATEQKDSEIPQEDAGLQKDMMAVIEERLFMPERSTAMATALHKKHPEMSINEAKARIDVWFKTHKDVLKTLPKYRSFDTHWEDIGGVEEIIASYFYDTGKIIEMIKALKEKHPNVDLKSARDAINDWFYSHIDSLVSLQKKAKGMASYQEQYQIHCPRCNGTNISFFFEEDYIPGKTETKYSLNLNPFKPFTIFNEKEKVKKQPRTIRTKKTICNTCGHVW